MKGQEREMAHFNENRRAMGMLSLPRMRPVLPLLKLPRGVGLDAVRTPGGWRRAPRGE